MRSGCAKTSRESRLHPGSAARDLRILHLGKYYPPAPGGIESHVQTLARAQARLGATVTVWCVNHRGAGGHDVTWRSLGATPTLEETDGPVRVARWGRRGNVARLDLCPSLFGRLARLGAGDFDLLHLHLPNATMLLGAALARPPVPLVATYHSDIIRQRALRLALAPFERAVLSRARLVFTDSPNYAEGSSALGRYRSRTVPLPLGIDLEPFACPGPRARAHAAWLVERYGAPLWLTVGRLVYYKGLPTALEALRQLPGRLLIVGTGPQEEELRRLAQQLGVAERVTFFGHAAPEELVGALLAATALWFPSNARSESFGLAQVEAMAAGCPVINTAIPHSGVPWVSLHEVSGLTVPVADSPMLARASVRLLSEPGLRDRLSVGARARAHAEFSMERMGRDSLALYARALGCP